MTFTIKNHRLVTDDASIKIVYKPTPNLGKVMNPQLLVMHYTGGANFMGSVNWLCDPRAKASAHLVVSEDGKTIYQLAPFNIVTWHAGESKWKDYKPPHKTCNGFAIGIELSNPGQLFALGNGKYKTRLEGVAVPADKVIMARHKNGGDTVPWRIYEAGQLETATQIGIAIAAAYPIKAVLGHDDIAPGRKTDPGPAFPMGSISSRILGRK